MDLISNSKPLTYNTEASNVDKYKNSSNNSKHTIETSDNSNLKNTATSNISDDAVTAYKFLNRIKNSVKDVDNSSFASKYTSEYKAIQKEINAGIYGANTDKYKNLLDSALKNAIADASTSSLKSSSQNVKIKMSSSNLCEYEKQSETATGLVWMFRAEHKRILKEIEDYRRKKNHQMVVSLTQLSNTYKQVIDNISGTRDILQTVINDDFNDESSEKMSRTS